MPEEKSISRNFKNVTVRARTVEFDALRKACEALTSDKLKMETSNLFAFAVGAEAARLGFTVDYYGEGRTVRAKKPHWPYVPVRPDDETLEKRFTVTLHPVVLSQAEQASAALDITVQEFLVGAAMRFVRTRQKLEPKNKALQAVELPEHPTGWD